MQYVCKDNIMFQAYPRIDINATDFRGYSCLHVAVMDKNVDLVRFLLAQRGIHLMDAPLHAVRVGSLHILDMLL